MQNFDQFFISVVHLKQSVTLCAWIFRLFQGLKAPMECTETSWFSLHSVLKFNLDLRLKTIFSKIANGISTAMYPIKAKKRLITMFERKENTWKSKQILLFWNVKVCKAFMLRKTGGKKIGNSACIKHMNARKMYFFFGRGEEEASTARLKYNFFCL